MRWNLQYTKNKLELAKYYPNCYFCTKLFTLCKGQHTVNSPFEINDNNAYSCLILCQMYSKGLFAMEKNQNSMIAIFSYYKQLFYMDMHHQN
jgi:hypothetical protein